MEEEVRALLLANSAVSALAGNRLNFGEHPQGADYPGAVLMTVSGDTDMHMNGGGGLEQSRLQVDCYGTTYKAAKDLSRAIIDALHFYRGGGFFLINHLSTRDSRDVGPNEVKRLYRTSLDFNTAWRPTT